MDNRTMRWGGVAVALVAVGAAWAFSGRGGQAPVPQPSAAPLASVSDVATVHYRDGGYIPETLTAQKGGVVRFVNEGTDVIWPAADPHPIHTGYPVLGGCKASAFDACRRLLPGEAWEFRFDAVGSWPYHDHVRPAAKGRIIVQE